MAVEVHIVYLGHHCVAIRQLMPRVVDQSRGHDLPSKCAELALGLFAGALLGSVRRGVAEEHATARRQIDAERTRHSPADLDPLLCSRTAWLGQKGVEPPPQGMSQQDPRSM